MNDEFGMWLNRQLQIRNMSAREAARRAGVSHTAVNKARSGEGNTSLETYQGLARALDIPLEIILREAGEMSNALPVTDSSQAVCEAFCRLDARHQSAVSDIVFALAGMPRAENAPAVSVPSRSGQTPVGEGEIDDLASATFDAERSTPAYIDQERELRLIFEHIMEGFVSRIPVGEREARLQQWVLNWVGKREREAIESRQ